MKELEIIKEMIGQLEYIENTLDDIKEMAKNAASLDTCSIDFYMELRNNSKIEDETDEVEVIDLGEEPLTSLKDIMEQAMSRIEENEKKNRILNRNIHTLETELNQTMCLKILDIIVKEFTKEKEQLTKSIKSKIS